jgi:hypothetical protein
VRLKPGELAAEQAFNKIRKQPDIPVDALGAPI